LNPGTIKSTVVSWSARIGSGSRAPMGGTVAVVVIFVIALGWLTLISRQK
jgi:hypothetical protein